MRVSDTRPELPGAQEPQTVTGRTLWPSSIVEAEDSSITPRRPPGYVSSSDAYSFVSSLPYEVVMQIAAGQTPEHSAWGDRLLAMQYVRAARELLSTKGNPVEINSRMDGPVRQIVEKKGNDTETAALLAILASLPPLPAQRRDGNE